MQLIPLSAAAARASDQARELLAAHAFLSEGWPGADPQAMARDLLQGLPDGARLTALADGAGWQWLAAWQPLAFDSELFRVGVGRLPLLAHREIWPQAAAREIGRRLLKDLLAQAGQAGLDCLYARVAGRDLLSAQALEATGFLLYDQSVEWMLDLAGLPLGEPDPAVRPWREGDAPAMVELAATAFCRAEDYADRFALDPGLSPGCPQLYRRWLANSVSGQQADQVLVLEVAGAPRGFITLKKPSGGPGPQGRSGWVVLNAIEPGWRGRGWYHKLLWAGLAWLREQGAAAARVRTKASQQAVIRAWARLGARQVLADLTYHYWDEQDRERS